MYKFKIVAILAVFSISSLLLGDLAEKYIKDNNRSLLKNLLEEKVGEGRKELADKIIKLTLENINDPKVGFAPIKIALDNGASPKKVMDAVLKLDDFLAYLVIKYFVDYIPSGLFVEGRLIVERKKKITEILGKDIIKKVVRAKKPKVLHFLVVDKKVKVPEKLEKGVKKIIEEYEKKQVAPLMQNVMDQVMLGFEHQEKPKEAKQPKKNTQIESFLNVWFGEYKWGMEEEIKTILKNNYMQSSGYIEEKIKDYKGKENAISTEGILPKDLKSYIDLILDMNKKEREFGDYYAFYHAYADPVSILWDFQTSIRDFLIDTKVAEEDVSVYLRFESPIKQKNIDDFIAFYDKNFTIKVVTDESVLKKLKTIDNLEKFKPIWYDNFPLSSELLSANFVPFGGTGDRAEGTFYYFISSYSGFDPSWVLNGVFDTYGFDKEYIKKIGYLFKAYMSPEKGGHMIQIFIRKAAVDDLVYLALPYGTPFRLKINDLDGYDQNRQKFISPFLKKYLNDPVSLIVKGATGSVDITKPKELINLVQARILMLPEFVSKNVKIVRYNFVSDENKFSYRVKFNRLVREMIIKWVKDKKYKTALKNISAKLEEKKKEIEGYKAEIKKLEGGRVSTEEVEKKLEAATKQYEETLKNKENMEEVVKNVEKATRFILLNEEVLQLKKKKISLEAKKEGSEIKAKIKKIKAKIKKIEGKIEELKKV